MSPIPVAICSLLLYSSLAAISIFYFCRYRFNSGSTYSATLGQFDNSKKIFFLVLFISASFDLPLYVGCLSHGGPTNCQWNSITYSFSWVFHLLALVGYAISLGIPLFLWSDIYHGRDGNLFNFRNYSDFTKPFLHLSICCYFVVQFMTVCALLFGSKLQYPDEFNDNFFYVLATVLEPVLILLITAVWLWTGVRLQLYVVNVCFRPRYEKRILLMINIIMLAIMCSYLLRAIMVLSLFLDSHDVRALSILGKNYALWVLGTRWLPNIFCSFLLIHVLQRSSGISDISSPCVSEEFLKAPDSSLLLEIAWDTDRDTESNDRASTPGRVEPLSSGSGSSMSFLRDFDDQLRQESTDIFFSSVHEVGDIMSLTSPGSQYQGADYAPVSSSHL